MRELSGRLEEIPGDEAFPAYLESRIAAFYERAGNVRMRDGTTGSVTIGGTVSPAGGNFDEPVTQATLKVVGGFHGLSRARSDARRYPAIDPLESWSHYNSVIENERVEKTSGRVTVYYTEPSDTLFSVAKRYHTTTAALLETNEITVTTSGGDENVKLPKRLIVY
jgi:vacuolar-type H+-ATPase catalytic subunit A/Vma1